MRLQSACQSRDEWQARQNKSPPVGERLVKLLLLGIALCAPSAHLELARRHDVDYLVPCEAEVAYERTLVCGQDVRRVASMTVRTVATPGHTPHHVSFAVGGRP